MSQEQNSFKRTPKQEQQLDMLCGSAMHVLSYGGGRAGKTFGDVLWGTLRRLKYAGSRGFIAMDTLNALKRAVIMDTMPKVLRVRFPELLESWNNRNKSDNIWTLPNGSQIFFIGLGNEDEAEKYLGTEYLDGLFIEVSNMNYRAVLKLQSRLAQKVEGASIKAVYECNPPEEGHWSHCLWVQGVNPLDRSETIDSSMYASILMNPADNLDNISEEYIKMLKNLPETERNRFLYGMWSSAVFGSVFGKEFAKYPECLGDYPYNPSYPVYTAWDIGMRDSTAIWFYQIIDKDMVFIDCYDNTFEPLPHYLGKLEEKGYKYGTPAIWFPHDGAVREWQSGLSRKAQAINLGWKVENLTRLDEQSQVDLVRNNIKRLKFDRKRCIFGLQAVKAAKYEYADKLGVFKPNIVHDSNSHYTKAFIYAIQSVCWKPGKEIKYESEQEKVERLKREQNQELESLKKKVFDKAFLLEDDFKNI